MRPIRTRLKQAAKVAMATGAALCVGLISSHLFGESTHGGNSQTPFTATLLSVWHNPDGSEIMRDTVVHGLKSDGSRAISTVRHAQSIRGAPPESFEKREIWDVGARMRYELFPMAESVSSYPLSDQRLRGLRAAPSDCSRRDGDWKFDATPQPPTILGYRVVKRSTGSPAPSAEEDPVIFEEWVAPELGCLALRSRLRNVGGASGEVVAPGFDRGRADHPGRAGRGTVSCTGKVHRTFTARDSRRDRAPPGSPL